VVVELRGLRGNSSHRVTVQWEGRWVSFIYDGKIQQVRLDFDVVDEDRVSFFKDGNPVSLEDVSELILEPLLFPEGESRPVFPDVPIIDVSAPSRTQ
jgi:hypothetical protein